MAGITILILLCITISLACCYIAEWSGIMQAVSYCFFNDKRIKPFDCPACLTFWVTLCLFLYLQYEWWSILCAFANAGLASLINKAYERIATK